MGRLQGGQGRWGAAFACLALIAACGQSCSPGSNEPPCLASGTYTLALSEMGGGSGACNPYDGATAVVTLVNLHYAATGSSGTGSIVITRSPPAAASDQWTQCTLTDHPSCQQVTITCTQGMQIVSVYLSNNADGPGFAQYQMGQCYDNYLIRKIGG